MALSNVVYILCSLNIDDSEDMILENNERGGWTFCTRGEAEGFAPLDKTEGSSDFMATVTGTPQCLTRQSESTWIRTDSCAPSIAADMSGQGPIAYPRIVCQSDNWGVPGYCWP